MNLRALSLLSILFFSFSNISASEPATIFRLKEEPLIRIGLETSAPSVTISTGDTQLVATSAEEQPKFLETARVTVSARSYQPPVVEYYNFEIPDIATKEEADQTAKDVREATGEKAEVAFGDKPNTWKVRIGEKKRNARRSGRLQRIFERQRF